MHGAPLLLLFLLDSLIHRDIRKTSVYLAMFFFQLFDLESYTYTYLLGCPKTRAAVIIDPVDTQVGTLYSHDHPP